MTLATTPSETPRAPKPFEAKPYGLAGLTISSVLIVAVATIATTLVAIGAFFVWAAIYGMKPASDAMNALSAAADKETETRLGIVLMLVFYAVLGSTVWLAARIRDRRGWRDIIGWRPWYPRRSAHGFWLLLGAAIVYGVVLAFVLPILVPESTDWVQLPHGFAWIALFSVLVVVFAPITEELVFRGWLYTSLREAMGIRGGIAVTSVLFALAHWESTHAYALAILPLGIALGIVREKAASLRASMALHALYNASAVGLSFLGW